MPEGIGPSPEFDASEARELGLSNSEWMRARWTGELPANAEAILHKRFIDQTTPREPRHSDTEAPTAQVEFTDFNAYKSWSMSQLTAIGQNQASEPTAGAEYGATLHQASTWAKASKPFSLEIMGNPDIAGAAQTAVRDIEARLDNEASEPDAVANLIDAEAFVLDAAMQPDSPIRTRLKSVAAMGNVELLGKLIGRDTPAGNLATYAFISDYPGSTASPVKAFEAVQSIVLPLAQRIKTTIERGGLEAGSLELRCLNSIAGDANAQPEVREHLEAIGYDSAVAVAQVVSGLSHETEKIEGGYPSHGLAREILETISDLYALGGAPGPKEIPAELQAFLRRLYREKVTKYSTTNQLNSLHNSFLKLADELGIDKDAIIN
ncbi:MAG TPA: hypothetical protein VMT30_00800 [Candidatus Saccharimonadia bacterium]|nr:hypothetical protein [Candidatus Saccharimonadia bacterium]